jgi:hypothetical protein
VRRRFLCLTASQELSRQRIGLASPDNSDTHDSNGWRGRRGRRGQRGRRSSGGGVTSYTLAASVEDREPASYRLHSGGSGGGLETSRGGAGGGPEPADIEGARSRSHGPAAERPAPGLGQQEYNGPRHSPAPTGVRRGMSDGHDWIGSKAVEITGSRVGPAAMQE